MIQKKLKILLIIEQCNPEMASVPLEGYKYFQAINKLVDATLVTHIRNKEALERLNQYNNVFYIKESQLTKKYYPLMASMTLKGRNNWPLANTLGYPIYAEFNHKVYQQFQEQIQRGDYDLVHALTPMMPRYPVKAVKACKQTPFLLGPVNGGVPFPPGFQEVARQEFAYLNFLRAVGRALVPGYVETYKKADKVLAGSTYTLNLLKKLFAIPDRRIELFYENGISQDFLMPAKPAKKAGDKINLLFVGRLVPYKCPDVVIESLGKLDPVIQSKIRLTIVGDGSERSSLENRVQELNLGEIVSFAGWVNQQETRDYYRKADIFCFPSIREFGGAVVIEAMACGLPCIVANNGGIGEYVTEETGFKIEPNSREYLTQELTKKIQILVEDDRLRESMSAKSIDRAKDFEWDNKAGKIVEIYEKMLAEKGVRVSA
ncbi:MULTISPECIES: glycosyltransferase family 4 protein [unclassified Microcoleus]|uniref:glycosyltransferase family 4 protein n=1 Tax=unclassified Microcoleus TaxID=2642155 RepID=UPI002FD4EDEF